MNWLPTFSSVRSMFIQGMPFSRMPTKAASSWRVSKPILPAQRDSAVEEIPPEFLRRRRSGHQEGEGESSGDTHVEASGQPGGPEQSPRLTRTACRTRGFAVGRSTGGDLRIDIVCVIRNIERLALFIVRSSYNQPARRGADRCWWTGNFRNSGSFRKRVSGRAESRVSPGTWRPVLVDSGKVPKKSPAPFGTTKSGYEKYSLNFRIFNGKGPRPHRRRITATLPLRGVREGEGSSKITARPRTGRRRPCRRRCTW